jgi:bile acid:Na+ symporter, BASS family
MIEALHEIDSIRLNFNNEGRLFLNLTIAFIMFGIALELKPDDFKKLFRSPKPALVGVLSQFLLMPLLTFLLAIGLGDFITPTIGMGMILVSACPGGNISNFISSLAKGNVALSVSLTAFSSLGGLFLTPFNFAFWGNLYLKFGANSADNALVQSLSVDAVDVLQTIVMILGAPLVIGIFVNLKFPRFTERIVQWIKRLSILVFIALIGIIFGSNFDLFITYIKYIFLIVLVHNALALTMGFYTGRLFGLAKRESRTIAIETGIQNSGLALALLFNPDVFPQDLPIGGMAFIAAWWGVWHIISGLTIAGFWSGFSLKSTT